MFGKLLRENKISNFPFVFSFVGFDHQINLHVHIVVRTFKIFAFSLYFIVFNFDYLFFSYKCVLWDLFSPEKQIFFSYRLFMPIDKAKESAAIAAVDEQINSVGRTMKSICKIKILF